MQVYINSSLHGTVSQLLEEGEVKLADKLTAMLEGEDVGTCTINLPTEGRPEPDPKRIRLVSSSGTRGRPYQRGRGGGGRWGPWGGRGRRGF